MTGTVQRTIDDQPAAPSPVGPSATDHAGGRSAPARVLIVSGSVGAGHDGAARELADRLAASGVQVTVRDFLAAVPRPVARFLREGYTACVGWTPPLFEYLFRRLEHRGLLWRIEQRMCSSARTTIRGWIDSIDPQVVVSTYPLASQTLGELRASGELAAPVLTYLTDPAVHISWLHPSVDAHLTVSAATATQGHAVYGGNFTLAGPLVPRRFASPVPLDELMALRLELGLLPGRPAALLTAGSLALGDMATTADDVLAAGFTPLVLCGRDHRQRQRLAARPGVIALGWRTDVHRLMRVADVLVHNAGGLSCTEAMVAGLPAVTYRPIPGHGRANAAVLDTSGAGPWARTAADLTSALHAQLGLDRTPLPYPDPVDVVLAGLPTDLRHAALRTEVAA